MVSINIIPFKGSFLPKLRQVIFLPTSTMKELQLQRGSLILLTCSKGELLFRCWPDQQVTSEAILPEFGMFKLYTSSIQEVNFFKGLVFEAESIVLSTNKYRPFMNTESFISYLERKLGYVYLRKGMTLNLNYLGFPFLLNVQGITGFEFQNNTSKEFYFIGQQTRFIVQNIDADRLKSRCKINDIIGISDFVDKSSIGSLLNQELPFNTQGVLVIGPPGTGKSFLIDAIQNEYEHLLPTYSIKNIVLCNGIEFLKKLLKKIEYKSPCLVLIDDIDKLFQNKDLQRDLLSIIYKILNSSPKLVIATCRNVDLIPGDLRKHGLMDKEIKFTIPSAFERVQITQKILETYENDVTNDQINEISNNAHGFTGGDLKRLCQEAYLKAIEENSSESHITFDHLQKSLKKIKPSSMAELKFDAPSVKWSDIGGMEDIKEALREMIDWPLKHPEKLKTFKIVPPRGILMYGPPGCSKTLIAKALASESQLNFINIKSSQVFNMYVGESERSVSELFKKARAAAPCILFLDEVDSLVPVRGSTSGSSNVTDRVVTQILVEIDGIDVLEQGISVIAATNRPDRIDPSLLRPGRLDRLIYVSLPDARTRKEIFQVILNNKPISPEIDLQYLVDRTANYTGAEISAVCLEACKSALKEGEFLKSLPVEMRHFFIALESVKPKTSLEIIDNFEKFQKKFQYS